MSGLGSRLRSAGAALGLALLPLALCGAEAASLPPPIPGGFCDATGTQAFFAVSDTVEAVDLATGQVRWTRREGRWPLASGPGWVAVAALDHGLRLRFLWPKDGGRVAETPPMKLPPWVETPARATADENGVSFWGGHSALHVQAWLPAAGRSRHRRDGCLRVAWQAREVVYSGIQAPDANSKVASGLFYVDLHSGKLESAGADDKDAASPAFPPLPKGWKPDPKRIYWGWSPHGQGWSTKPRTFQVAPGLNAYFSYEGRRQTLFLETWRPGKKASAFSLASGREYAPLVCLDGGHAVLASYENGKDRYQLVDLSRPKDGVLAELPPFEGGLRSALGVLGSRLYHIGEKRSDDSAQGTDIERSLYALDWAQGRLAWSRPLGSLHEDPPIPGAGPR